MKIYENIFLYSLYLIIFLTILAIFGLSKTAPIYLKYLKTFLQIYIGLLLVYLYNPFIFNKNKKFTDIDRKIIFTSGSFLLFSSALISYIENFVDIYKIIPYGDNIENLQKYLKN